MYALIRRVENWVYRQGARICVNSPGFVENLVGKGVEAQKIRVVMDWADEQRFFPTDYDETLAQTWGLNGKFNIVYGGNLGTVQGLDVVLQAARLLRDLTDVQFVFIGDGTETARLQAAVAEQALHNVVFIPRQPPDQMHRFFALGDLLFVHLKRKPIFEIQTPSKIIAYLACGRPILCAMHGVSKRIIEEANAGVTCPSEDSEALAKQVRQVYHMPAAARAQMGQNGRQAYLANYTRAIQVDRLEHIFKEVTGMPSVESEASPVVTS